MSKPEDSAPPAGANAAAPAAPETAHETDAANTRITDAETGPSDLASAARKSAGKGVWMGTAVGIGSAAIVAALLYTRKKG